MNNDIIETVSNVLTKSEKTELHRHELDIEDGIKSFVKVGNALNSIKEKLLYRERYDTFDEYVKDRWSMGRHYAYRLIRGSEIAGRFPELTNEAEARELNKVPYTDQGVVLERAKKTADMEGKKLSARHIKLAAELQEVAKRLGVHPEGCWFHTYADTISSKIKDLTRIGVHTRPAGACPECAGGITPDCDTCRDRGWLPKGRLDAVNNSK